MIVTIDGPAGAGKSSVARVVAQRLGFEFLDTGAMYRAVTWAATDSHHDWSQPQALVDLAARLDIQLRDDHVYVNGRDITTLIRSSEITGLIHYAANNPGVRTILVDLQRRVAASRNMVTEGRDQGTVAFPHAECKLFLTASPEERARRRLRDLQARQESITFEEVLRQQNERDARDARRDVGPLRAAEDAIEVCTDDLTHEQVVDRIERIVRERMATRDAQRESPPPPSSPPSSRTPDGPILGLVVAATLFTQGLTGPAPWLFAQTTGQGPPSAPAAPPASAPPASAPPASAPPASAPPASAPPASAPASAPDSSPAVSAKRSSAATPPNVRPSVRESKPPAGASTAELLERQRQIEQRYQALLLKYQQLAQSLESREPEQSQRIAKTLARAKEMLFEQRLAAVMEQLRAGQLPAAIDGQQQILVDLQRLLRTLQTGDDATDESPDVSGELEQRLQDMLARQKPVTAATQELFSRQPTDGNWRRADRLSLARQADEQKQLTALADEALQLIESVESAAAVRSLLESVRADMQQAAGALAERRIANDVLSAQNSAEATLSDLLRSLARPKPMPGERADPSPDAAGEPGAVPPLLPPSAVLKLLRTTQDRLEQRTSALEARRATAGQLNDADRRELTELAKRQEEIERLVGAMLP